MSDEPMFQREKPLDLSELSEDDLAERITKLEAEIVACKEELERKKAHRSAVDKLFGG
ncbi:MAG: DUF1192 domain-containing protein [Pseudomonadota bacterium]